MKLFFHSRGSILLACQGALIYLSSCNGHFKFLLGGVTVVLFKMCSMIAYTENKFLYSYSSTSCEVEGLQEYGTESYKEPIA